MAHGTIRFAVILLFPMAIGAVSLGMDFIQLQPGHGVFEILLRPGAMTGDTIGPQFGDPFSGGMAPTALQFGMIFIERPAGRGMRKSRLLPGIMAGLTTV